MDNVPPFSALLASHIPLVAHALLDQLHQWVKLNPWFRHSRCDEWFTVEASVLEDIQSRYNQDWAVISMQTMMLQPFTFTDRRFRDKTWSQPFYGSLAALYLLNTQLLMNLLEALLIDAEKDRRRLHFLVQQMVAAWAPSNFLGLNPEAQQRMIDTQGASLLTGLLHLASDMHEGKLRQCDSAAFEVGVDLALTPGGVVHQTPLFQLIQYAPQSEQQYRQPLLIVPPTINKYYILDLQPKNSMIRYLLEQGHPVFLISWRSADMSIAEATWDDYLEQGILEAIRAVQVLTGEEQLNALGYCIGGTLLCCALAVLAARGQKPVSSLTLLTSLLDFQETGEIGLLVDEEMVRQNERSIGGQDGHVGLFRGEDMANTFSLMRPNDLWWNYGVDKYLKGLRPKPLDLLYWNNDSTDLPGAFYCWYLRHAYLQNDIKSGTLTCCGETIDLSRLDMPAYVLGTREDHIVPWHSAYSSMRLLGGPKRFVLGASGHIAGVINPPAANKRSYWTDTAVPDDPQAWLATAAEQAGSWWPDWMNWLDALNGAREHPARTPGSPDHPVLEAAPGRYVKGETLG